MALKYDFSGYATKNDLKCSDGKTIRRNAFIDNDGQIVPLVWQHLHDDPNNVLGHALLENREDGVYAYCSFNDTESGRMAKELVKHGDIRSLSIYANKLKQKMGDVVHGCIREVSLVLAGANPGAMIDCLDLTHSDNGDEIFEEAIILPDLGISTESSEEIAHSEKEDEKEEEKPMGDKNDKSVQDVIDSMNEDQKAVLEFMVGEALKSAEVSHSDEEGEDDYEGQEDEGGEEMKHSLFENQGEDGVLMHKEELAAFTAEVMKDAKKNGSLKEAVLAHADDYGIKDIEMLFPDARTLTNEPEFIKRKTDWVADVFDGASHSPFSRIKSVFADITADEARARGYIKGNLKKEEVFTLLKRTTEPCTVYKKQKLDRDDIIDITDFNVVSFVKGEMRIMFEEEVARAALIGDGRLASSDDKIPEDHIRPIWKDAELYSMHYVVTADDAEKFIDQVIAAMADYEGSGNPTMFMPQPLLTACLLLKDQFGHYLYKTKAELATVLQVGKIVAVPVMKDQTRVVNDKTLALDAIVINMKDYRFGADKGGQVSTFEDFDIDYNQFKYLMEGRCSGAITKPKSALVFEHVVA